MEDRVNPFVESNCEFDDVTWEKYEKASTVKNKKKKPRPVIKILGT